MPGEVSGRIAVVTGGGSGIGRAIALALAGQGAAVAVADISEASAAAVAAAIVATGHRAEGIACDVSDRASVRALHLEVQRRLGQPTLLIANAGVALLEPLTEMADADIDWVIQVNLFGVINCLHTFLPDMMRLREGHVVATASSSALLSSFAPHPAYVAAKSGVVGLMLSVRRQLREFGIGATVLCPGRVSTQIVNSPRYRPERFGGPTDGAITLPSVATGAFGRMDGRPPEEVAQMVLGAIRENRAMVVTDRSQRALFEQGFADLVLTAFDQVDQFDRVSGGLR
jgi:NAD(P)-dependent dehydrogenase (short-subunit alcohol dehydrogenase family)